jgi:hypothetical protein
MRAFLLVPLALLAALEPVGAQTEIVASFRGYAWGSTASEIEELEGLAPAGTKEGMIAYVVPVTVLGRRSLAGFYFHPRSGALLEGAYVIAMTPEECPKVWPSVLLMVEQQYPALVKSLDVAVRPPRSRNTYESDCEYYAYNPDTEHWGATFTNPGPPGDRVLLTTRLVARSIRLTVVYRGAAGQAWAASLPPPER